MSVHYLQAKSKDHAQMLELLSLLTKNPSTLVKRQDAPKPSSQRSAKLFAPERQRVGSKKQRQKVLEGGMRERMRGLEEDRTTKDCLDTEETDVAV